MYGFRFHSLLVLGLLAGIAGAGEPRSGYFETAFDVIPPYARADVIAQRALPPEELQQLTREDIAGYTIDPREEKWQVYVPEGCVRGRCGLLVWIHAEDAPSMDNGWRKVLDDEQLVYVAALRSGNDHDALERRLPLALTGLGAMASEYSVDASRVYLGGHSGGAKVAEILAFAYPDVFHGVILNAGFLDPASESVYPPPAPLDQHLRKLPFVLAVGRRDDAAWKDFLAARDGFAERGMTAHEITDPRQGHVPLTAARLREALELIEGR